MKKAGAGVPSAEPHHAAARRRRRRRRRDAHGVPRGPATRRSAWRSSATTLYVANTDARRALSLHAGRDADHGAPATKVADLPGGPLNHHWTKNVIASRDGTQALRDRRLEQQRRRERHRAEEEGRAAIWEVDRATGAARASSRPGLRNPNGMALGAGRRGALWTVVNERDELGSDLVPDYLTSVQRRRLLRLALQLLRPARRRRACKPPRPDLVAKAIAPDYALGPHTASLGLAFADGDALPPRFASGDVRRPARLVEPQAAQRLQGDLRAVRRTASRRATPVDVLTGFVDEDGEAHGRPVGVAIDKRGALLVADDVGNVIWRVTGAAAPNPNQADKAERFKKLHEGPGAFVIPNPWDAGSARILAGARLPGAGHLERRRGRRARPARRQGDARRGARARARHRRRRPTCRCPPISRRASATRRRWSAETIRLAAEVGLVGGSIEDATGDKDEPLYDFGQAVERVAAAVAGGARAAVSVHAHRARRELPARQPDLDDTIKRLQAFEKAGADVLMAPGLPDLAAVRAVCAARHEAGQLHGRHQGQVVHRGRAGGGRRASASASPPRSTAPR